MMKLKWSLILILAGLNGSTPSFSQTLSIPSEENFSEQVNLNNTSNSENDFSIRDDESNALSQSACFPLYNERLKKVSKHLWIHPALAPFGITASSLVGLFSGAKIGSLLSKSVVWGGISGGGYGVIIGFWGASGFFIAHQVSLFIQWHDIRRMIQLIDESYSKAETTMTTKLKAQIKKRGVEVSVPQIQNQIRLLDQEKKLCDGSMRGESNSKKLRKRLAKVSDLEKSFLELRTVF